MDEGLNAAKRLIAAASREGARILGAGVSKPCAQARYNHAAVAALMDPAANYSQDERRLIGSFIQEGGGHLGAPLSIRLDAGQRAALESGARAAGLSISEYARAQLVARKLTDSMARALLDALETARSGQGASAAIILQTICQELGLISG